MTSVLVIATFVAACQDKVDQRAPTAQEAAGLLQLLKMTKSVVQALDEQRPYLESLGDEPLDREARETLMPIWATLIDLDLAYASYRLNFLEHWKQAPTEADKMHALIVGYAAHVAQTAQVLSLVRAVTTQENIQAALDEGDLDYGISPGHWNHMVRRTISPHTFLILNIGRNSLNRRADKLLGGIDEESATCGGLGQGLGKSAIAKNPELVFRSLLECVLQQSKVVATHYQNIGPILMEEVVSQIFSSELNEIILPIQTEIALWMGDTKFRNDGEALIAPAQIEGLLAQQDERAALDPAALEGADEDTLAMLPLEPGDILVERRNWYLSNLGLPGFWPHAALFIGTAEEMDAYFDTPEVRERMAVEYACDDTFAACMERLFPEDWATLKEVDEEGHPYRVIEAVSEGVVFTSLEHSAHCDYLGVMRPLRTKTEKAIAIIHAFEDLWKPYDFEFDFATDSALVCSEVVHKAWDLTSSEGEAVEFELADVYGRMTLPPNDMVEQFQAELGTEAQQLSFVAFLDGNTGSNSAFWATSLQLQDSWRRPKWDLNQ